MVATRGQTGSNGPVTSTPTTVATACHTTNAASVSEAGSMGRCGECTASTDPTASAVSETQTSQMGTSTRSTQMGPTLRSGFPWLATDDESGTEPKNPFSQGDRPDPLKMGWERTVGGVVGENRRLVPSYVILVEETECCDGRMMDPTRQCQNGASATLYSAERSRTEDYGQPEAKYYVDREPWYTQSKLGRPCPETVW